VRVKHLPSVFIGGLDGDFAKGLDALCAKVLGDQPVVLEDLDALNIRFELPLGGFH
jgi:hypothetical protein